MSNIWSLFILLSCFVFCVTQSANIPSLCDEAIQMESSLYEQQFEFHNEQILPFDAHIVIRTRTDNGESNVYFSIAKLTCKFHNLKFSSSWNTLNLSDSSMCETSKIENLFERLSYKKKGQSTIEVNISLSKMIKFWLNINQDFLLFLERPTKTEICFFENNKHFVF